VDRQLMNRGGGIAMMRRIAMGLLGALLTVAAAHAQTLQKLVLFGQPSVNNDSVWMALANGYYKDVGLDVDYRPFPSGMTAFQSFKSGQGDIIMTGDLPAVQYFLADPAGYQAIAAIERDAKGYVAVASNAIKTPQDLAGKTIATRVGSTGSWFISEYLTHNGVDPHSVTIKNLDTQLLPTALCGGDIAAFFIWQPIGSRALEICSDKAHLLTDASGYIQGYLLAGARPQWLQTPAGADMATRFLKATIRGRDKAAADFPAVAAYAAAKLSLSEAATRAQWDTNLRPIALDEIFYHDFCSESRWAQANKITDRPLDFSAFTWTAGLRAIDPKLVSPPPPPC
jgi:ABC-type nitrate/sulfonate/bicarbonate transport system substrate-binding protein